MPVGHDSPQAAVRAVEEVLEHRLRGSGGHAPGGIVEGYAAADEM